MSFRRHDDQRTDQITKDEEREKCQELMKLMRRHNIKANNQFRTNEKAYQKLSSVQEAFDSMPYDYLLQALRVPKVNHVIIKFLEHTMGRCQPLYW